MAGVPSTDYAAAVEGLRGLAGELVTAPGGPRKKFRLEDMRSLLAELREPQLSFPAVLVAGTNGKGSTAATLASILAAAGYRVGLFTSPHLLRVNERIQLLERAGGAAVRRAEIEDESFARLYFEVDEASAKLVREGRLPEHASFFETVTALGFLHFARQRVDLAVLEVGMGGRLDATNVVEPLISVITDISLDHTEWLGSTIDLIAREKAGILRPGGTMVTLPQLREANEALGEVAVSLGVTGISAAEFIPPGGAIGDLRRNRYSIDVDGDWVEIDSPLAGHHQQRNIALAIATALELRRSHGYILGAAEIVRGIRETAWAGRLELLPGRGERADILLDVAHNPAGAWALRSGVSAILGAGEERSTTLVFGCLKDKALAEMAQILFPLFDRVLVSEVGSPRTAGLGELQEAGKAVGVEAEAMTSTEAALSRAVAATSVDGLIVVGGSVYLVGEAKSAAARTGAS